jgi:UDP-N-acetyl-D-glucosamine dehydrogenase
MKTAVVGLGYVGLPLSLQFARSRVSVLGMDVDPKKVELLNNGQSYIKHIEGSAIAELLGSGKFSASTDLGLFKEVEAVIICVPTPLKKNREPDLSFIMETGRTAVTVWNIVSSFLRNLRSEQWIIYPT